MQEEIKYNKDEKWIPYKQLAETPQQTIDRLKQENKELKEEISKLGKKHEDYCNTMYWQMKEQMDKYRSALEEIRNYCDRIEQGSVIGTQDCLINSIKNIVNYTINEVLNPSL